MDVTADSLDDLLFKTYSLIRKRGVSIAPTKGQALEVAGASLRLTAPRARLSRTEARATLFSCLGELLWYLSARNDLRFIEHYIGGYGQFSDDRKTIFGAYGPRIFGEGDRAQIHRVIELLRTKPDSRQAVVQIFDRGDLLEPHKDVPCTCTLQFMLRENRLLLLTTMRSNDAWLGLPHDIFCFTMIQELVARSLGVELGDYKHFAGSLHLYVRDVEKAARFQDEGMQRKVPMPPMPSGDPWPAIRALLAFERRARRSASDLMDPRDSMDPYWADLATLLAIHASGKAKVTGEVIQRLKRRLHSDVYATYINRRFGRSTTERKQLTLIDTKGFIQKGEQ